MNTKLRSLPIVGLVCAESLSLVGNQVAVISLPILVLQFTNSPLVTGIASAGNIIPIIIAAFVGGRAIDRFGAWKMSVCADVLSAVSVLALPLAFLFFDDVSPLLIFLLVLLGALFDPTGIAARETLVPRLARLARIPLQRINAYRGGLENGADFVGPIVGAGLIHLIGVIGAFFVNAFSFFICALVFALTVPRTRVRSARNTENDIWRGIRFVFQNHRLKTIAVMGIVTNFVLLPFLGLLLPLLAMQKFESATLLGLCLALFGLSTTMGSVAFPKLVQVGSRSIVYFGGFLVCAGALIFCAFADLEPHVLFAVALAGFLLGAGNPLEKTIFHEEAPMLMAGQVATSLTAVRFGAGPLGLLLAGVFCELWSTETTLLMGGSLLGILTVFVWFTSPGLDG